ncbi:deoxyhypusine synthase-like isoform X2 [Mercenaria mercenaria]|uniref:deoxyhypusine synthase-like isoform X2 n=1 Tax=Mercenaria mercenaria TaxID=6596 RepID=UPI00234F5902|nr:deoxyhypusine synthase-like isoform X2 [Mercenaria mercenaria]
MASYEDWKSETFRSKIIQQINEAKKNSSTTVSTEDMEKSVFDKAKNRDEYLALVTRLILHLKDHREKDDNPPSLAAEAVLMKSESLPEGTPTVKGYDFNEGIDYHKLLQSYTRSGFQAQNFGKAVEEINKMIDCKLQPVAKENLKELNMHPTGRPQTNCSIFLSYTSNLISAGVREVLKYLVQHNMVDCVVTTAGGIEEDFIKCMAPTYMGEFSIRGRELRDKGINRIGNLLVPNDNYCKFEDWLMPILDKMLEEQKEEKVLWTPSRMIDRLGKEINNPDSVYYWAHKNNIPVYCPAITDGSLGDMIYFHSYKNPGLVLDLVQDIRGINSIAVQSVNSGMIILGGGVIKHHTCNANLMRNGADFAVYLNTASEFDGSDSGASPDEAISWGKIKKTANPVKITAEATLVFPLLVAETFARRQQEFQDFSSAEKKDIVVRPLEIIK